MDGFRQAAPIIFKLREAFGNAIVSQEPAIIRHRSAVAQRRAAGFTLPELMITIGILAILLAIAVPSFSNIIKENRNVATVNSLTAAISLARAEAIRRSRNVSICASTNGLTCGGNWQDGWLVLIDSVSVTGATPVPALPTDVLQVESAQQDIAITQMAGPAWIRFSARGLVQEPIDLDIKPTVCKPGVNYYRDYSVNLVGRVGATKTVCP